MATDTARSLPLHKLDNETYSRMVESGALDGEPVEMLDGLLVEMSPQGFEHTGVIVRLTRHLGTAEAWLYVQLPLEIPPNSTPEPDLALVEKPPVGRHASSALLVVEASVTSHALDRGFKARLYAKAGVTTYWLIDVPAKQVEVRTRPGSDGYRDCASYGLGHAVPSPAPGVADLDVGWVFGRS
jgi:Uma2 family endonuclease